MKKIWLAFLCVLCTWMFSPWGGTAEAAGDITAVRWVTRNDAANPYVRIVFDLSKPIQTIAEMSGTELTVTLKDAKLKGDIDLLYKMNPDIASKMELKKGSNNITAVITLPNAIPMNQVKVFALKKDDANKKPPRLVVDIPKKKAPVAFRTTPGLKGKIIAIDPGHGGTDVGAIGAKGTYEKNITLPISLKVQEKLAAKGAKVVMTRTADKDVNGPHADAVSELQARVDIGENGKADVFVSIHIDSFVNGEVGGITSYYMAGSSYGNALAAYIHRRMNKAVDFGDRNVRTADFYVLNKSSMPAVLLEIGFISNPSQEKALNDPATQDKIAQSIVEGIEDYFNASGKI